MVSRLAVRLDAETRARIKEAMREPLGILWLALTEAMYLLHDPAKAQDARCEVLQRGTVQLLPWQTAAVPRISELMRKYANRPMDLADAALVRVARRKGPHKIYTVGRKDFSAYRLNGRVRPVWLP